MREFPFLGSEITADGDCSHEIIRCLLLGRKVIPNLDSILKSRDTALVLYSILEQQLRVKCRDRVSNIQNLKSRLCQQLN